MIEYLFVDYIGYAKTKTSLMVLSELGLIVFDGNNYTASAIREKTELTNSDIYNRLKGGDSVG